MFRLIVVAIVAYVLYRLGRHLFLPQPRKKMKYPAKQSPTDGEDMVKDPYCGMYVPISGAFKVSIDGKTVYFCSEECCEKYEKEKRNES